MTQLSPVVARFVDQVPKMRLSVSQIGMWLRCPRQWEFRYVKNMRVPPAGVQVQGSAYHGALEVNFKFKKDKGMDLSGDDISDAYDQAWRKRIDEEGGISQVDWDQDPGKIKGIGANLVKLYHQKIAPLVIDPELVEERDEIQIEDVTMIRVRDLVLKDGTCIDHKVTSRLLTPNRNDIQSVVYMYPEGGPFEFHVALRHARLEVRRLHFTVEKDETEWWKDAITQIAKQMASGVAPPNMTGYWCSPRFCGYWPYCRGAGITDVSYHVT